MEDKKIEIFDKPKRGFFCFQPKWRKHSEIGFLWRLTRNDGKVPVLIHGVLNNDKGQRVFLFSPLAIPNLKRMAREDFFEVF